jgi:hypothetical protein
VLYSCEAASLRSSMEKACDDGANLRGADLRGAKLEGAWLRGADLRGANLDGAKLTGAALTGADLRGATMPDGRLWEAYQIDPLAGVCDEPEARERAKAAWGEHAWGKCPMSAAHGWKDFSDVPADKARDVAAFVAVFDGRMLG